MGSIIDIADDPQDSKPLLTYELFAVIIENICMQHEMNHIEAICHYCEEHDIDVGEITHLINRSMKEKIKVDAQSSGLMKKESMLPI